MKILGIDPGATTGWCVYDIKAKRVLASGEFDLHVVPTALLDTITSDVAVVVETPVPAHAGIYPQTVACGYTTGRIVERIDLLTEAASIDETTRHDVKKALHAAIFGEFPIKKDRDVWAALKMLHGGEGCDKKGGPLYGVKSHARAALAVAVAYALRSGLSGLGAPQRDLRPDSLLDPHRRDPAQGMP